MTEGMIHPMEKPDISEVRHLLHDLRDPLGAFFIHVGLLEGTELTAEGQSYLKAMRVYMEKARAALDEIDFALEQMRGFIAR